MSGEPLHCVQRVLPRRGAHGAPEPVRRATMQHARVAQAVDDQIRERRAPAAGAGAAVPEGGFKCAYMKSSAWRTYRCSGMKRVWYPVIEPMKVSKCCALVTS